MFEEETPYSSLLYRRRSQCVRPTSLRALIQKAQKIELLGFNMFDEDYGFPTGDLILRIHVKDKKHPETIRKYKIKARRPRKNDSPDYYPSPILDSKKYPKWLKALEKLNPRMKPIIELDRQIRAARSKVISELFEDVRLMQSKPISKHVM